MADFYFVYPEPSDYSGCWPRHFRVSMDDLQRLESNGSLQRDTYYLFIDEHGCEMVATIIDNQDSSKIVIANLTKNLDNIRSSGICLSKNNLNALGNLLSHCSTGILLGFFNSGKAVQINFDTPGWWEHSRKVDVGDDTDSFTAQFKTWLEEQCGNAIRATSATQENSPTETVTEQLIPVVAASSACVGAVGSSLGGLIGGGVAALAIFGVCSVRPYVSSLCCDTDDAVMEAEISSGGDGVRYTPLMEE